MIDPARLKVQLLNTGLQNKDQPLYQLLNNLIDILSTLTKSVSTALSSGASSSVITNIIQQLNGMDGIDGMDGPPGPMGLTGSTGAIGPSGIGIGIPGIDGTDGLDGLIITSQPNYAGYERAAAYSSVVQSISDSTFTGLTFDTNDFDNNAIHSVSSNTSRFTVHTSGIYEIQCTATFAANSTGKRDIKARVNGTTDIIGSAFQHGNPSASNKASIVYYALIPLNAGDYVEFMVFQNSGGALNVGL